jgi:hypothetical protein
MQEHPDINDAEIAALLGSIVIWWGRVENLMFRDMLDMRRHPDISSQERFKKTVIATKKLISQWCAAALILETEKQAKAQLKTIRQDLYDCAEDRNALVHGLWDYPEFEQRTEIDVSVIKPVEGGQLLLSRYRVDAGRLAEVQRQAVSLYHRMSPFAINRAFANRINTPQSHEPPKK